MMVYTTGHGVHGFTLDPSLGEFLLSHENIRTPPRGKIYSINEGNSNNGMPERGAISTRQRGSKELGHPYSLRYIGSLVADFHRNLLKGGIFLYPGPKGKLRLLYEAVATGDDCGTGRRSRNHRRQTNIGYSAVSLHQKVPLIHRQP